MAPTRLIASFVPSHSEFSGTPKQAVMVAGVQEITVEASDRGYTPNYFAAASGQPIRIRLVTNGNYTCSNMFTIPSLGIQKLLAETGEEVIDVPAQQHRMLYFTCGMGMYNGAISIS